MIEESIRVSNYGNSSPSVQVEEGIRARLIDHGIDHSISFLAKPRYLAKPVGMRTNSGLLH